MVPKLGKTYRKQDCMKMFSSLPIRLPISGDKQDMPDWRVVQATYNCSDKSCGCTRWTMTSKGGRKIHLDLYSTFHGHAFEALRELLDEFPNPDEYPYWAEEASTI